MDFPNKSLEYEMEIAARTVESTTCQRWKQRDQARQILCMSEQLHNNLSYSTVNEFSMQTNVENLFSQDQYTSSELRCLLVFKVIFVKNTDEAAVSNLRIL